MLPLKFGNVTAKFHTFGVVRFVERADAKFRDQHLYKRPVTVKSVLIGSLISDLRFDWVHQM
jgi:hypothetical protein